MNIETSTLFAVQQTVWFLMMFEENTIPWLDVTRIDSPYERLAACVEHPELPCSVYRTRAAAEAEAERLTHAARAMLNPFWFVGAFDHSKQTRTDFHAGMCTLGIVSEEASSPDDIERVRWWERNAPAWTDAQRNDVWDLRSDIVLYRVCEVEYEG